MAPDVTPPEVAVSECSRSDRHNGTVLRPTTPPTAPASSAGMLGVAVSVNAVRPEGRRTEARVVPKAAATAADGPRTGRTRPSADAAPTVNPWPSSQLRTAATVDGLAPNRPANWPGARYCRYDGDPGVDTASTKAATAARSGTARVTSTATVVDPGRAAPTTVPCGRD